jgi:hypothetical protein
VAAGAGVGGVAPATAAAASVPSDHEILIHTLSLERLVVWCYERVLGYGTLGPAARAAVTEIHEQERQHVAALLAALGGGVGARPLSLADATTELGRRNVAASPSNLGNQHDCLRLLVDVESVAEGTWFRAISKLGDPAVATTAARIMACEAQHWTALTSISHHGDVKITVPYAFVRGT